MKQLTQEEIQSLFEFTQKHYVEYYDLQIELVDHLACGIEQQWEDDETIPFEKALDVEFKKFGIFGFTEILEQREKELKKRYLEIIKQSMLSHLKKIEYIGSLILFAILCFVGSMYQSKVFFFTSIIFIYGCASFFFLRMRRIQKAKEVELGKKLLLWNMFYNNFLSLSIISVVYYFWTQFIINTASVPIYFNLMISITIPILSLLLYVSCYFLPNRSDKILNDLYPEYRLITT